MLCTVAPVPSGLTFGSAMNVPFERNVNTNPRSRNNSVARRAVPKDTPYSSASLRSATRGVFGFNSPDLMRCAMWAAIVS